MTCIWLAVITPRLAPVSGGRDLLAGVPLRQGGVAIGFEHETQRN
jgi:hypothetical protein